LRNEETEIPSKDLIGITQMLENIEKQQGIERGIGQYSRRTGIIFDIRDADRMNARGNIRGSLVALNPVNRTTASTQVLSIKPRPTADIEDSAARSDQVERILSHPSWRLLIGILRL
jgi:hypothetical protein